MFNLKTLAALTVAATGMIVGGNVQPAQAMCITDSGYQFCLTNLALQPGQFDSFTVTGPGVNEKMNVMCHGGRVVDWNSYGNLSESHAHEAATEFCSGRGTTGTAY